MSEPGLREFLKAATENETECLSEYPDFIDFIDKIDGLFRRFLADEIRGDPMAGTLFINAHASFLAACRIAVSGQSPPTFMALRGALESALFGLIASRSEENRSIWLDRDRNLKRSRKLYSARSALKLLEDDDPNLCAMVAEAYELTIEFGAHPNARSVMEHLTIVEGRSVTLTYLQSMPSTAFVRAVLACIETGLIIIYVFPHAFPDHGAAIAIHGEAAKIREELDQYLRDHKFVEQSP